MSAAKRTDNKNQVKSGKAPITINSQTQVGEEAETSAMWWRLVSDVMSLQAELSTVELVYRLLVEAGEEAAGTVEAWGDEGV